MTRVEVKVGSKSLSSSAPKGPRVTRKPGKQKGPNAFSDAGSGNIKMTDNEWSPTTLYFGSGLQFCATVGL
ncbi:hypothetical protein HYFRA_00006069 [Hymenoscyphus fraxineus]|uniref:Uncharacterized protein n=1 Tax=Hymenoscyphus fraxineus TaxID=746836 RepID=A0A9N9PUE3_9HELO|nr:hypothetical protein HYFRA_00006069 [Hymenoscyphus fraxineus]